jgi:hypothetical protein
MARGDRIERAGGGVPGIDRRYGVRVDRKQEEVVLDTGLVA